MSALRAAALVRTLRETQAISDDMSARHIAVLAMSTLGVAPLRSVGAIAETLGVPKSSVSRCADALQANSLLRRVTDRDDRRVVYLEATPGGRERAERLMNGATPPAVRVVLAAWRDTRGPVPMAPLGDPMIAAMQQLEQEMGTA